MAPAPKPPPARAPARPLGRGCFQTRRRTVGIAVWTDWISLRFIRGPLPSIWRPLPFIRRVFRPDGPRRQFTRKPIPPPRTQANPHPAMAARHAAVAARHPAVAARHPAEAAPRPTRASPRPAAANPRAAEAGRRDADTWNRPVGPPAGRHGGTRGQSRKRRTATVSFCPPKPNELLRQRSTPPSALRSRAALGT